jgi:DNA-binding protein
MKKIVIKATGKTVEKSDFVADLFIKKGLAKLYKEKELKTEMETKELKTKTKKK